MDKESISYKYSKHLSRRYRFSSLTISNAKIRKCTLAIKDITWTKNESGGIYIYGKKFYYQEKDGLKNWKGKRDN